MRTFSIAITLLALSLPSCGTLKRSFDPPLVAENDTIKVSVEKLRHKKRSLRVWMTLQNMTDKILTIDYGNISAEGEGHQAGGALRVPFVRLTKPFPMSPKMIKRLSGPVEFIDFPKKVSSIKVSINGIKVAEDEALKSISIDVPVHQQ